MAKMKLLKKCRLITELSNGTDGLNDILIKDGIIEKISTHIDSSPSYEEIDCQGKTLLPGLYDIHQHCDGVTENFLDIWSMIGPYDLLFECCGWAKKFLKLGYTTLRDMGSTKMISIGLKNAIERGIFTGPRIIAAGGTVQGTAADFTEKAEMYDGADEWRKGARVMLAQGADFVKIYTSGSIMGKTKVVGNVCVTADEVRAATEVAKQAGTYTASHAHGADAIQVCLDAGVYTIEHGTFITNDQIQQIKNSDGKHYLVPTVAVTAWCESAALSTGDNRLGHMSEKARLVCEAQKNNIRAAYKAGLKLGWGTDLDIVSFAREPGQEFRLRKEWCDMSNIDMLLQATKYSAEIVGLGDISGQIKEGYEADLILMSGNPDEDISVMNGYPEMVIKGGTIV